MTTTTNITTDLESPEIPRPSEDVRDRVLHWLEAEGWKVGEASNQPDTGWFVICERPLAPKIVIGQQPNRPNHLVLQGTIALAGEDAQALENIDGPEQEELLWEIRFFLLELLVEFNGVEWPLGNVTVTHGLYVETLTQNDFSQCLTRVRHALLSVIWKIKKKLGERPITSDGESHIVN